MTNDTTPDDSIYSYGLVRTAVCVPHVKVAAPGFNTERTLALAQRASEAGAAVALFPELGLSAYSNDDLHQQDALLDAVLEGIDILRNASRDLSPVLLLGAPLRLEGKLFNCAVALYRGSILGVVPKSYLPNYREFYEGRQFTSGRDALQREVTILGQEVPFGADIIFAATNLPDFALHVEICEDLWVPLPPSTWGAMAGATILCNLSASNITIGKADYRRDLCAAQSGKCIAAYLYSCAGPGESTTDLAWDGHALIYENNERLAESERFSAEEQIILADVDLERLRQDRMRTTSFNDSVGEYREQLRAIRRVGFEFLVPHGATDLRRPVERFPYVPNDPALRDERCFEAYNIQVHGLVKRMSATGITKAVIGVSGGLDSTHALIVVARAMDLLGLPRTNILAYTMPGFATSNRTYQNAWGLMRSLGTTAEEVDIRPSALQMLKDIGHPYARGEEQYDVTFENVQAGERTSHLFRLANLHNGLVVGTGDLSELALGWCTYGVGDHMSHYNVNASVPKTLIQHLIRWTIDKELFDPESSEHLQSILDTAISPELVPPRGHSSDSDAGIEPSQSTEAVIGPYELQDFNLYYITRYGFRPSKVVFLAWHAWRNRDERGWPAGYPEEQRNSYDRQEIRQWLRIFLYRFFKTSQFKRSCVPNGPKVGSGGSLSPRGDWRAPSDSEAELWLKEIDNNY